MVEHGDALGAAGTARGSDVQARTWAQALHARYEGRALYSVVRQ